MKGLGASSRLFELKNREPRIPLEGGVQIGNVKDTIRYRNTEITFEIKNVIFFSQI